MWRLEGSIFSTMWMRRNKRIPKSDSIELQEGRSLMRSKSQDECTYTRAHHALYLGYVPVSEPGGKGSTENPVSLLLDKAALDEQSALDYIYIDVKPQGLIYYQVDFSSKVINSVSFNISRVSYCSGDHVVDPCVFAWIFHQETTSGFQLECHAVRVKTERRAKLLAFQLQQAFHALYKDVQAALESSKLFHKALTCKEPKDILVEQTTEVIKQSQGYCDLDIPGKEVTSLPKPDLVSHPLSTEYL